MLTTGVSRKEWKARKEELSLPGWLAWQLKLHDIEHRCPGFTIWLMANFPFHTYL